MASSEVELIKQFLEEEVKEHEFLGFFGINKNTTTIAKGRSLRIDLQGRTTERPGEPRSYNLQLQVNNGAEGVLARKPRTSKDKSKVFKNSKPTLATILVDEQVDKDTISEEIMKGYWLQVIEPQSETSKNKGRVDKSGQFTKEKEEWEEEEEEEEEEEHEEAESSKAGGAKNKKKKKKKKAGRR